MKPRKHEIEVATVFKTPDGQLWQEKDQALRHERTEIWRRRVIRPARLRDKDLGQISESGLLMNLLCEDTLASILKELAEVRLQPEEDRD